MPQHDWMAQMQANFIFKMDELNEEMFHEYTVDSWYPQYKTEHKNLQNIGLEFLLDARKNW